MTALTDWRSSHLSGGNVRFDVEAAASEDWMSSAVVRLLGDAHLKTEEKLVRAILCGEAVSLRRAVLGALSRQ